MNLPTINAPNRTRSHGRAASGDERRRVAVPRRSTKGPLDSDVDDPLAGSTSQSAASSPPRRVLSPAPLNTAATSPLSPDSGTSPIPDLPSKDFSYLLEPSAYHALPSTNIPQPFLNSPALPSLAGPLPDLLKTGHYRLAAISAARGLSTSVSPSDAPAIFELLHIRLACLCLLNEHAMAAQEAKLLGDLSSAFYRHPLTGAHLVPWELRVLSVRLAALGYGEWRKGIMGYYELAREARENVVKTETHAEKKLWKSRLRECGIRVANVLVEMGELEGAGRHLGTLSSAEGDSQDSREVLVMEALVWLRVGDLRASRRCVLAAAALPSSENESTSTLDSKVEGTLNALLRIAEGDYNAAVEAWTELHSMHQDDAMITQNLAVSLLYTGKISEARSLLTDLAGTTAPFHALTFNLCTVYELCTERSRDRKIALAERIAAREPSEVGWEMAAADFKL
ncbi:uncharacterized protein BDZ99DRAFT_399199 [Mytilinidion resinicola]|uniref:TPR-like protein n=1 Tax=Mytilinidion resinicola TaxID=574789 RepID=A0A6A6Y591_9PEZI|nr:uncharacterized protein BDZ99DRAFT_399199 [Mytilinidion resinicola]KAF2803789.1 hypothetical protein BDZ99DRAFT_399199 [Mytilinidion resinicola]